MGTILDLATGVLRPAPKQTAHRVQPESTSDRKQLERELEAVRRKEHELLRAIALVDHPELSAAISVLKERARCVTEIETRLAEGLSSAEERRRDSLVEDLKLLSDKRDQLDVQIAAHEIELRALGEERSELLMREHSVAIEALVTGLREHAPSLHATGLNVAELVPGLPVELAQLAHTAVEAHAQQVLDTETVLDAEQEPISEQAPRRTSIPPALPRAEL